MSFLSSVVEPALIVPKHALTDGSFNSINAEPGTPHIVSICAFKSIVVPQINLPPKITFLPEVLKPLVPPVILPRLTEQILIVFALLPIEIPVPPLNDLNCKLPVLIHL